MQLTVGISALLLLMPFTSGMAAGCWENVQQGQHSQELECRFADWEANPSQQNANVFLKSLFFTYISDGGNLAMKSFFDRLRSRDPKLNALSAHKKNLIQKYTFQDSEQAETAAIWTMQPQDARALFVLSQTEAGSIPPDIASAVHLAVYNQIDQYFYLKSAYENSFAVLPHSEYLRLLEILERMANVKDPYLTAVNLFYRGIVNLNLGLNSQAITNLQHSRNLLNQLLPAAGEVVALKRILGIRASANILLGNLVEAESDYVTILKMDPNDWNTLLELSYLLNRRGECKEPGVWIEAYLKKGSDRFDIVLHCGNQEYPDELFISEPPVIASLHQSF